MNVALLLRQLLASFTLVFAFSGPLLAQTEIDLAEYYFRNGEYEQARLYYDKIWKTDKSNRVYDNYLATLIALDEFDEAESIIKKKLRGRNDKTGAHLDLGSLYLQFDRLDDAEAEFDKALKELQAGRSQAIRLANAFVKLNRYDYALLTYERAQKIGNDGYPYHFEIANIQGMMGQHEAMVDSFLELLLVSPNYIQTVQNSLARTINPIENQEGADLLSEKLIKQVQRYPNEDIFSELLVWLFTQKKAFDSALIHAKAIDMRRGENGLRVMEIGNMARRNEDWNAAYEAYAYVAEKGSQSEYYIAARTEMLRARTQALEAEVQSDQAAFEELVVQYENALSELGRNPNTAGMMKELAHLYAFRMRDSQSATALLEETIALPGLYERISAQCKLELADILLLEGDIWEASLLYSQVELAFKEDVLGSEARLRNARISYYTGDFDWAQAQLDVLKASTSKLISNDAIELSLLITDNYNMDTTVVPMQLFAQAQLLAYQNRIEESMAKTDSLLEVWPGHTLKDEILLMNAKIHLGRGEVPEAERLLNEVVELHFQDILADDALFMLAELAERHHQDVDRAMELYGKLMAEYPGSLYVVESRKRFRALRGDQVE